MKTSHRVAVIISVLTVLWVVSGIPVNPPVKFGSGEPSDKKEEAVSAEQQSLSKVKIAEMQASKRMREVVAYGSLEAGHKATVIAEVDGIVEKIVAGEGSAVKKGDVILKVDVRDRAAKLEEAKAKVASEKINYESKLKLSKQGFASELAVAQAKAALDEAAAVLAASNLEEGKTDVTAPFDGRIDKINVKVGDFITRGGSFMLQPVAVMTANDTLMAVGYVTESERREIAPGGNAEVKLIDGAMLQGKVNFISAVADTVTRTFRLEVTAENKDKQVADGESVEIHVPVHEEAAYLVPKSALVLDDKGTIGVKLVNAESAVEFKEIKLLADSDDGVWVSGLPSSIKLITLGQMLVGPGERVEASSELPVP